MKRIMLVSIITAFFLGAYAQSVKQIYSPDKHIKIEFAADSLLAGRNAPAYRVFYNNKAFLLPSAMGFEIGGQPVFSTGFRNTAFKTSAHRNTWKPPYGERENYPDNYDEMEITLQEQILPNRSLKIIFRAYNEGIAFRYEFPDQPRLKNFTILKEITEFAFPENTLVWEEHGHEGLYTKVPAGSIAPACELPLTVRTADGIYAAIAEAGNSNYPRSYVQSTSSPRNPTNTIAISLRGEAKGGSDYTTAWRMITLGDRPGALMEQNYLLLNLSKPSEIKDPSWIKPGKAVRDNTLSTAGSKKFIDYAQQQGINYVILDWGWYGIPFSEFSDPSAVNVVNVGTGKPIPGHPGLNIPEVVAYGKAKGVGIFLYVNRQGLERYMDKIFPVYEAWGIKGIKPGFVNVGNQEWQVWVENVVKKAADHHLMVDIHDAYRPSGFSRTYPNLLTQEGIRGNEHTPDADHNTTLPFTRYTIGAGDYTPGYCRGTLQNTWTHRLSLPIIYYSPGQFLFWGEALTGDCHNRPELALWRNVPTTWQDTKVLDGAIGEYIVVARRSYNNWFVGGITNKSARTLRVDMRFLKTGKSYEATIYQDDAAGNNVLISTKKVNAKSVLSFPLLASGGFAIELREK